MPSQDKTYASKITHSFGSDGNNDMCLIPGVRGYDWDNTFTAAYQLGINRFDVKMVIASAEGCKDERNWVGIFQLKDGRYLYVSAWCDFTGWECQSGGVADFRDTIDDVCRELCTDDDRHRMNIQLTPAGYCIVEKSTIEGE